MKNKEKELKEEIKSLKSKIKSLEWERDLYKNAYKTTKVVSCCSFPSLVKF